MLAVDDPRRPPIRRAVFGTIWAAAVFFVFAATKELKTVYGHSPWLNDPYDTVISTAMFFVPLVTFAYSSRFPYVLDRSRCPRPEW